MWLFRDQSPAGTTRALNRYKGDHRGLSRPATLHFICSPTRAAVIVSQVAQVEDWFPISVYEPIPDRCIPEELPALRDVLPLISVLRPFAGLQVLHRASLQSFLDFGVGPSGTGSVVIRSGSLGVYVASRSQPGTWIDAYWRTEERVVDVTGDSLHPKMGWRPALDPRAYHISLRLSRDQGAGNSFLGGLAAGLVLTNGDVFEAALYGTVSASYTVEQLGLPKITWASGDVRNEEWNGDSPWVRLHELKARGIRAGITNLGAENTANNSLYKRSSRSPNQI
ncbi:hypothetical protein EDB83DRAFT_1710581 [Lactarius deliciosus]|nr:hypothetical protein EDB83DRAFT_1710581 [Lactarius deliciosus]